MPAGSVEKAELRGIQMLGKKLLARHKAASRKRRQMAEGGCPGWRNRRHFDDVQDQI